LDNYFYKNNINYFRYSDDIIIFSENKEDLYVYQNYIKNILNELDLCVNSEKEFFYDKDSTIDFLGFSFKNDSIDIARNSIYKAKSRIKRYVRFMRRKIENNNISLEDALKISIKNINKKFYGNKREELSWKYWFFPIINSVNGLNEIDKYYQEELRYLSSGKHNKKNYKCVSYEMLKKCGYKSLVHEYYTFVNKLKQE
jgi:hypothetical protein